MHPRDCWACPSRPRTCRRRDRRGPWPRAAPTTPTCSRRPSADPSRRAAGGRDVHDHAAGKKAQSVLPLPAAADRRQLHRHDRPPHLRGRSTRRGGVVPPFLAGEVDLVQLVSTRFSRPASRPSRPASSSRPAARRRRRERRAGCRRAGDGAERRRLRRAGGRTRLLRVRAGRRGAARPARAALRRGRHLRGTARGVGLRAHRPPAGHVGRHRERRGADQEPPAGHEPCPPGLDHDRDHGDRRRRRGAPPAVAQAETRPTPIRKYPRSRSHDHRSPPKSHRGAPARGRADRRHRRPGHRRRVPASRAAGDQLPHRDRRRARRRGDRHHRRGGTADRRGQGALRLPEADRRPPPRRDRAEHRPRHLGPGRGRHPGPRLQRHRRPARHRRHRDA